jgi:hypothetical protein
MPKFNYEPAIITAIVVALVNLIVAFAGGFGITIEPEQAGVAVSVLIVVAGLFVRSKVTPNAKVEPEAQKVVKDVPAPPTP